MTNFWRYDHYDAKCDYIFDKQIVEYDIQKANISILHHAGAITDQQYQELYAAGRMIRQYTIGCMQRDNPEIKKILSDGLRDARKRFCERFNLQDYNILHINKDAIFVVFAQYQSAPQSVTIYDNVVFTNRGSYLSYYKLDPFKKIHFYVGMNQERVYSKVRGISSEALDLHRDYFLKILENIAATQINMGIEIAYKEVKAQFMIFSNPATVDYHYKRRFDAQSMFDLKQMSQFSSYQVEYVGDYTEDMIDSSYNLGILARLGNIYLSEMISHQ